MINFSENVNAETNRASDMSLIRLLKSDFHIHCRIIL